MLLANHSTVPGVALCYEKVGRPYSPTGSSDGSKLCSLCGRNWMCLTLLICLQRFRQLVATLLPPGQYLSTGQVQVRFVMDRMPIWQAFPSVRRFSPVSILTPMFNIHLRIDTSLVGKTTEHPGNLQTKQFFLGHRRSKGQKSTFTGIFGLPFKPTNTSP